MTSVLSGTMGNVKYVTEDGNSDDEDEAQKKLTSTLRARTQSFADVRLRTLLNAIRKTPDSKLKEQCVRAEWAAIENELDREVLMELVQDGKFWDEVKQMAEADLAAVPEEVDGEMDLDTRLAQMFQCFDKDNSGSIDQNELHQMLLYMGVSASEAEVKEMIRQVDKNGDGDIDLDEFMTIMKNAQSGQLGMPPVRKNTIRRASLRLQQDQKLSTLAGNSPSAVAVAPVPTTTTSTIAATPQTTALVPPPTPPSTALSPPRATSPNTGLQRHGSVGSVHSAGSGSKEKDIPSYMRGTHSRGGK